MRAGTTVRPSPTHALRRSACLAPKIHHGKVTRVHARYDAVDVEWYAADGSVLETEVVIAGTDLVRVRV